jgi:3-oxoadipate enol-lactonase
MATQTFDGIDLHYTDHGTGLPVALVHAFPLDSRMWDAQVDALAGGNRVIAMDLPGFGRSADAGPFTIDSMAERVHALLAKLDALPCVLAGVSMGGYISLAFATEYPADLRGLMLIDTKAEADSPKQKEGRQQMIDLVRKSGSKGVAEQMLPKMLAPDTPRSRPAVARRLRSMMEECSPTTIENALIAMRERPDRSLNLPSISLPTLVTVGEHDAITPVEIAHSMQSRIPKSELVVIRGAGHLSPYEQPAQVNQAMTRFLARIGWC